MGDDQAQFDSLLQNLMSPENDARTQAEEVYEGVPFQTKVTFLIQSMKNPNGALEVRTMAAVLLRRLFSSMFEDMWPELPPPLQAEIKHQLLISVQEEQNPIVRRKMCDCVAEFARNMLDDDGNNTWPEVLKFLFDCTGSTDATLRESALIIFAAVPGVFGSQQSEHINVIKGMLQSCLADQHNPQVRQHAAKATTSFLLANDKEKNIQQLFKDLLPGILQCVAESINTQDDDALLKCIIDMAETIPKYLRPQLETLTQLTLKIISDSNLPDQWRQLALEVIVTLSENAPAMMRKNNKFLGILVPHVLAMMVDMEDEADWATSDEVEEEDQDSNAIAGESALDRMACALGGQVMLPHLLSAVPQMLANVDWRYRHAALMALSASGEGCHKQMEAMLTNIVEAILPFLQDPHPRVRYATCNALGQMSTDFGPVFQKKFHARVVPGLLMVMDDYGSPRVQAHAGAALVNFSEDCPKSILLPYLEPIISKLEQVLNNRFKELLEKGTKLVLEQVVTTLASVADTAEEKFVAYYDRFMPCLKYIVQNATNPELRLLRGKTIECISLIGLAVGKEKFMSDCSEVMQLLLKTQTDMEELADDDPQISYMISAWARMCKILGPDFEQYLPLVMGPVLRAASLKPEVTLVDADDVKVLEGDQDWQFVTLGDQQSFGIRTSGLEEKATACQMLVCYARELKQGFAEYTEDVVKLMVAHLKFYFHDGVRIAAGESLPYLLECAQIRGPEYLTTMWGFILPELLKAIDNEPETDIKAEHMHSLGQCIEKMGSNCLSEEYSAELIRILDKTMKEHFEHQAARMEQRKDEDYDEVVEETLLDEDDQDVYILSKVSDIMHGVFGAYKETALPLFEQLLPHFVKLLTVDHPWPDHQWALCIFDDLIEHAGPRSLQYQEYFLQPMIHYICDKQGEVRQAASYGIGVMAQFGGEGYAQACAQAMPQLLKVIQDPDSRQVENLAPTENAISAVTKICRFLPSAINVDEVLPHWLSWLPVWDDEDEAVHIYTYLCDLVEGNHPRILGENNQNLPNILQIIAEAFSREAVSDDLAPRMANIVRQVQSNDEIFQACLGIMTEQQKQALSEALSSPPAS